VSDALRQRRESRIALDTARRALEGDMAAAIVSGRLAPMPPAVARRLRAAEGRIEGRGSRSLLVLTFDGSGVDLGVHGVRYATGVAERLRADIPAT
jgi:hypothetical protein